MILLLKHGNNMAANTIITFDGYDLSDITNYIPESSDHQSAPTRDQNVYRLARQDGSKLVSQWWGSKYIKIPGYIQATSQSALEDKIDELKAVLARPNRNLDITWGGSTRRYVCSLSSFAITRDPDMIDWCAFEITFFAANGHGVATSTTTETETGITTSPFSDSIDIAGSAYTKPTVTITVNSETDLTSLIFSLTNSYGESSSITVTQAFAASDIIIIDYSSFSVSVNGVPVNYNGSWGQWYPGSTSFSLTTTATAQDIDLSIVYTANYL
jgi:hypothetical protein